MVGFGKKLKQFYRNQELVMEPLVPLKLKSLNYIGHSMHPLFKAGDRLQIVSYGLQEIRVGDVVVFIPFEFTEITRCTTLDPSSREIKTTTSPARTFPSS